MSCYLEMQRVSLVVDERKTLNLFLHPNKTFKGVAHLWTRNCPMQIHQLYLPGSNRLTDHQITLLIYYLNYIVNVIRTHVIKTFKPCHLISAVIAFMMFISNILSITDFKTVNFISSHLI